MNRLAPALLALLLSACASTHIAPYVPKQRTYAVPEPSAKAASDESSGSLWRPGRGAAMLFTDARALNEQDLVVVKVEEIADAKRSADTETQRSSELSADVSAFLAALNAGAPALSANAKLAAGSKFTGLGSTARMERLTATVPAIVRKVLPNGNLFIEGHRVVLVNNEEHHFYISGVVRPIDIDGENSVKSSTIADAEIEFTGRGVLSDNQDRGWFSRHLGWLWPF